MTNFEKLVGVPTDKFLTYLMLLVKYFVFICKFKDELPNIVAFKSFVKKQKEQKRGINSLCTLENGGLILINEGLSFSCFN